MIDLLPPPPETYAPPPVCRACGKWVPPNEWVSYHAHENCVMHTSGDRVVEMGKAPRVTGAEWWARQTGGGERTSGQSAKMPETGG